MSGLNEKIFKKRILHFYSSKTFPKLCKHPADPKLSTEQERCLQRSLDIISRHQALMLFEKTGTGKTYIASALAAQLQRQEKLSVCLIANASLLKIWKDCLSAFQVKAKYYSYQKLSLGSIPAPKACTLYLLDEAQALKNPLSKRYKNLLKLSALSKICLITATPVSMAWRDLLSLAQLCGYRFARQTLDLEALRIFAECLQPQAYDGPLEILQTSTCAELVLNYRLDRRGCLQDILLAFFRVFHSNPLLPPSHHHQQMLARLLIDRLLSHPQACLLTIQRLKNYCYACTKQKSPQMLFKKDFIRIFGLHGKQWPLPFELPMEPVSLTEAQYRQQLSLSLSALSQLESTLQALCAEGDPKVEALQAQVLKLNQEQVICFTKYVDTAEHFWRKLKSPQPIALLTAQKAFYGSSPIARETLLELFQSQEALSNCGLRRPQILICSDAFAVGHNFQRASILVQLDLPYNPCTLIQRKGRLLRLGQEAKCIHNIQMLASDPLPLLQTEQKRQRDILKRRETLLKQWPHAQVSTLLERLQTGRLQLLFIPQKSLPALCLLYDNEWLPLHPKQLQRLLLQVSRIDRLTLQAAFETQFLKLPRPLRTLVHEHCLSKHHIQENQALPESYLKALLALSIFKKFQRQFLDEAKSPKRLKEELSAFFEQSAVQKLNPQQEAWVLHCVSPNSPQTYPQASPKISTG